MSFEITDRLSRPTLARITGALYLTFMVTSVLADSLAHIGLGDAQQISASITTNPDTFRLGLVSAFASTFFFLMAAWGLYVLLRTVNQDVALLFLLLNAVGVAVQCASMLQLVSAMHLGDAAGVPSPFQMTQTEAQALLSIEVYRTGFVIAQLFFGTWLFPLGYLVYKSGFLPRFLGVLLILDGVFELIWFFQALLLPAHPEITIPGTFVSLLAEVGLTMWLLIRGVSAANPAVPPLASAAADPDGTGTPK